MRPSSSVPYVWDEPTKPTRLTVVAPGGASASYDMTTLKEGNQLTYENFIYVCLSVTFAGDDMSVSCDSLESQNQELVLDVPEGTRVILSRKEAGKRSQLWRMTGSGMLQHEGSSPPRDPAHPVVSFKEISRGYNLSLPFSLYAGGSLTNPCIGYSGSSFATRGVYPANVKET